MPTDSSSSHQPGLDQAPPSIAPAPEGAAAGEDRLLSFSTLLFDGVDAGELALYSTDFLARLSVEAHEFVLERTPGLAKIRVRTPSGPAQPDISIVEILNDDMPFLLDSVLRELVERGLSVHLVAHPIFRAWRDGEGGLIEITSADDRADRAFLLEPGLESFLHIHVERIDSAEERQALCHAFELMMTHVRAAVSDFPPMKQRLGEVITSYREGVPEALTEDIEEAVHFLEWLLHGNFVFLGMRSYELIDDAEPPELRPRDENALGLLRDSKQHILHHPGLARQMSPRIGELCLASEPIFITKASLRSDVHRRVHMDTIGVKLYSDGGRPVGELRIVGLFTSSAYHHSLENIPLLRRKTVQVLEQARHSRESHSGRSLLNVLESYPRDELFRISVDELASIAQAILQLELKPRVRVFPSRDPFERFVSLLIYIPRDRYNTRIRERVCNYLATAYGGTLSLTKPFFTDAPLVRLRVIIWRRQNRLATSAAETLEAGIEAIVKTWDETLSERLRAANGYYADRLIHKYASAFPIGYQETSTPERATHDIERLEKLSEAMPIGIDFFRSEEAAPQAVRVTLYQRAEPISLSRRLPIFENLGFAAISERTFRITPARAQRALESAAASGPAASTPATIYLHEINLCTRDHQPIDIAEHQDRLEQCFLKIWAGNAANDASNGLLIKAGLDWREAALFRTYGIYLRQIGAPFGQTYLSATLLRHGDIVAALMALFRVMFDPGKALSLEKRRAQAAQIVKTIESQLETVASLDEDRILRHFLELIRATERTNFYQSGPVDGAPETIAFKLASRRIECVPEPRPFAEIFVLSPRVAGVHLRGGPIARGGIRWSDRPQDFRSEVQALAKAQHVKNAVIIPQGAKGGFVPRQLALNGNNREARQNEAIACYKLFISSLLAITDNLKDGVVAAPEQVVRYDGDDPYLVVAADKGTASFSDIANEIAEDRGFWLDDAFASGGSAGYDHKKMGITARGAWESVKRHFREMGTDIQSEPFTVIGIGDMSGDVFGNGMLLSRQIRLLAAFDHRDIFFDPNPDPETSWAERKRLFELPRSSWQDYNRALISPGGGIFSRQMKYILLSDQMRARTGINVAHASPNELIRAILKLKADLLWFGGIGTFVRALSERDEDVHDRANDGLRVSADQLRVKVIGEGANLGITQKGRIAFALAGGRINTDAIDNSGGVNSSDLEVNIKIALRHAEQSGKIDRAQRNEILAGMTGEVTQACLRNNYLQTLAISLGERRGLADLGFQARLMRQLEADGTLGRDVEFLPSDAFIAERKATNQPLTRPELAVLLAYSKIALYDDLIAAPVSDDPYLSLSLQAYFPKTLRARFRDEIEAHPLRREIIATQLANLIINRGGSTFVIRMMEETGHDAADIAHAFAAATEVYNLERRYAEIDALDNRVNGEAQIELYRALQDLLRRQTAWFLRHGDFSQGLGAIVASYQTGIRQIAQALPALLSGEQSARMDAVGAQYVEAKVPIALASRLASLKPLAEGLDIILAAHDLDQPLERVAAIYYAAADYFRLDELREAADSLARSDYFDRLAVNSTLESAAVALRGIVRHTLALAGEREGAGEGAAPEFEAQAAAEEYFAANDFATWRAYHGAAIARTRENIDAFIDTGEPQLAKLMVAVAHLRDLAPA